MTADRHNPPPNPPLPRFRRRHAFVLLGAGFAIGAVTVAATTWMVSASSSDNFCAGACHSMQWAAAAYERGPHYSNALGVRASCADCHIPYEDRPVTPFQYLFGTLWTKGLAGVADVYHKLAGTIEDKQKWEVDRSRLSSQVDSWLAKTHSVTCQGCHDLAAFSGKGNVMAAQVHAGVVNASTVDCTSCHTRNVGHVYDADLAQYQTDRAVRPVNVPALLANYGCVGCHAENAPRVGPSYRQIAAKYAGATGAAASIEGAIQVGGSGAWGSIPMPAQPQVPDADRAAIAAWILQR